jgi:hypothetical protein
LLILDDCIADLNFHQSPSVKKIFSMGRHINITIILTTQYLYSVSPLMRNNADYVMCGAMNRASVSLLADEFSNIDRKEFIDLYNQATKDYSFMVINCNNTKDNTVDSLYGCLKVPIEFIDK